MTSEVQGPQPLVLRAGPDRGVSTLTFNRPNKLNAMDPELRRQFAGRFQECLEDEGTRVVVIRGAGRAFSVGLDVTTGYGEADTVEGERRLILQAMREFLELWTAPKPVLAEVHGHCMGIATILTSCCDLVLAAEGATFGWPKLPLGAGLIGPVWSWHIGVRKAKELSFQIGAEVSGREAVEIGFANHAYAEDVLAEETRALAQQIARTPPELLRIKKEAINAIADRLGFRQVVEDGAAWDALARTSESVRETESVVRSLGVRRAIDRYLAEPGGLD